MAEKGKPSGGKHRLISWVALLDDVAVLALLFLVIRACDVDLPLYVLIIIGLVAGTFIYIMHRAVVFSLHRKKVVGRECMLGLTAEVTEPLSPRGVVKVGQEYWKAVSVSGDIDAGEEVEIIDVKGLSLEVKRREP